MTPPAIDPVLLFGLSGRDEPAKGVIVVAVELGPAVTEEVVGLGVDVDCMFLTGDSLREKISDNSGSTQPP